MDRLSLKILEEEYTIHQFPENKEIPDNSLVVGSPGRVIRKLTSEEIKAVEENAIRYQNNWKKYSESIF